MTPSFDLSKCLCRSEEQVLTAKQVAATEAAQAQAALHEQIRSAAPPRTGRLAKMRQPKLHHITVVDPALADAEFSGNYSSSKPHDGWPHFVNEHKWHLFYHIPTTAWRIAPHEASVPNPPISGQETVHATITWPATSSKPVRGKTLQAMTEDGCIPGVAGSDVDAERSAGWYMFKNPHWTARPLTLTFEFT